MQRWGVTLGLCILILSAACGGNPTAPPNLPSATAPPPTAQPVEATRAPTPTPSQRGNKFDNSLIHLVLQLCGAMRVQ